jgi:hypothetical protein
MSVPVNLYVDRMSPVQPVRVADIYSVTQDRSAAYSEAAAKIGLTTREYAEFRDALTGGNVIYVVLPRHIDAMAGVHRNGKVYALRNVVVPSGTMGWQVNLADGTTVLVPRICGNLSMNRGPAIAKRPRPKAVAVRTPPKTVRAAAVAPLPEPVAVVDTPVTFAAPPPIVAAVAPEGTGVAHQNLAPFAALLFPIVASFRGGGSSPAFAPAVAPCSAGSNATGVCQQ